MKYLLTFVLVSFMSIAGNSQDTTRPATGNFTQKVDSVAEKLVQMALLNARVSSREHLATQNLYEYKRSKSAWLNNIVIAGNLNELSIKQQQGTTLDPLRQSTQYPRYNVGASIPLGLFINNGKQTKANFHRYESFRKEVEIEKQIIRGEVLLNYENYLYNKQLLALQQEIIQDAKVLISKQEEKFGNGQLSLEDYTASVKAYNNEHVKELNITHTLKVTEIALEELIGMNLQDALAQIEAPAGTDK